MTVASGVALLSNYDRKCRSRSTYQLMCRRDYRTWSQLASGAIGGVSHLHACPGTAAHALILTCTYRPEDRKRRALIGCPEAVGVDCVTSDPTPVGRAHVSNPKEVITLPPALDNRRYRMLRSDGRMTRSGRPGVHEHAPSTYMSKSKMSQNTRCTANYPIRRPTKCKIIRGQIDKIIKKQSFMRKKTGLIVVNLNALK